MAKKMREFKFRGKRVDNGEWVYGNLIENKYIVKQVELDCADGENTDLIVTEYYEVTPKTIGQYTGLHDKNGNEIYEGDIVRIEYSETLVNAIIEYRGSSFYGVTNCDDWELDMYYNIEILDTIHEDIDIQEQ